MKNFGNCVLKLKSAIKTWLVSWYHDKVDSVMQSTLQESMGSKIFALDNQF